MHFTKSNLVSFDRILFLVAMRDEKAIPASAAIIY
jgi:hypothetical protein